MKDQAVTRRGKVVRVKCRDEREAQALEAALDGRTLAELDINGRTTLYERQYEQWEPGKLFSGPIEFRGSVPVGVAGQAAGAGEFCDEAGEAS